MKLDENQFRIEIESWVRKITVHSKQVCEDDGRSTRTDSSEASSPSGLNSKGFMLILKASGKEGVARITVLIPSCVGSNQDVCRGVDR